jgi:16S rRNA processing protein RimM
MHELLGRIIKLHGHEGAVSVRVEKILSDNIPEMEFVFLRIEGKEVPFFVDHYQINGQNNLLIWFRDYNSVEKVKEFIGCQVILKAGSGKTQSSPVPDEIIGFELITKEKVLLGVVTRVTENPGQWLITVITDSGNEILIPFHEDLIISIQKESKRIIMNLPDGLGNLN